MVKFNTVKQDSSGPSSSIGIMRFSDSTSGPKITPELVIVLCVIFAGIIFALRVLQ